MKTTTDKNEAFCKAYRCVHGEVIDNVEQLVEINFRHDDVPDVLLPMCEYYHIERKDQESFQTVGNHQYNQLELTFYKWTNPFFWIWAIFYGAFVFVKSLFVTNKDFKR